MCPDRLFCTIFNPVIRMVWACSASSLSRVSVIKEIVPFYLKCSYYNGLVTFGSDYSTERSDAQLSNLKKEIIVHYGQKIRSFFGVDK